MAGTSLVPGPATRLDPWIHAVVEALATTLALVIGATALVVFRARRQATHLFIGTGFLAASVLDAWHALLSSPPVAPRLPTAIEDLAVWSWLAARFFLAIFLLATWWVRMSRGEAGDDNRPDFRGIPRAESLVMTAGGLVLLLFLFLLFVDLPVVVHADAFLPRPLEIVPGALFAATLVGIVVQGGWRKDPLEHALVLFLGVSAFLHIGPALFSGDPTDLMSLVARLLKVGSYLVMMGGLLIAADRIFVREREASMSLVQANAALSREIQVRRETQREFRQTQERLADFLDHAHDLIHASDREGRIVYANQAWKRRLGYSEQEIRHLRVQRIVRKRDLPILEAAREKIFRGEPVSNVDIVFIAKDGSEVPVSGSANCRFENGVPIATRTILRDISGEKAREAQIARMEANLRAVFESTSDPIWSVDREGRLVTMNTAMSLLVEVITGRSPVVGEPTAYFMDEASGDWFQECYDRALQGSRFSAVRVEKVAGEERLFDLHFHPIESQDGGISGVVVFARDTTQQQQVEEALRTARKDAEEASESKSNFLANMSHELRTPLNSVIGFSNLLLRGPADALAERERGFLERIQANGKHLLGLINEILDLSKIEAGRLDLQMERVDLPELMAEVLESVEAVVADRPVKLVHEVEGTPDPLATDRGRMKQILLNLVANALKFTESGSVTLRLETASDGTTPACIRVRDTGIGIPEDRLDSIFRAFEQAEEGTARRFGGTGLGLTISRSLCVHMGYDLTVRSRVGEGSEFTIALAGALGRLDTSSVQALETAHPPVGRWEGTRLDPLSLEALKGRTVLVVDDEEDSRALMRHTLEEFGCRVVVARDGVEGLQVARAELPDLITVDLMMPRMNGWEMLRAIREDPDVGSIPVVVVSLVAGEGGGGHVLGAVDLLSKPVEREALLETLRRNLTRTGARVLVVEDDDDARVLLTRYLADAGFASHGASNGAEALHYLRKVEVDLILTDLLMPVMDGISLIQRVRANPELERIPIVVLTGKELTDQDRDALAKAGAQVLSRVGRVEEQLIRALDQVFRRVDEEAET